jgi:hypothetical protein
MVDTLSIYFQGFDQVLVDYVHERKFPVLGPVTKWGLRLITAGVLVGIYQFNTNDIGTVFFSLSDRVARFADLDCDCSSEKQA